MDACWRVIKVQALEEYRLLLTFAQGERKIFDMKPYLQYPMYQPLQSEVLFRSVHTNGETAVWNDDIDIAPETLYEDGVSL